MATGFIKTAPKKPPFGGAKVSKKAPPTGAAMTRKPALPMGGAPRSPMGVVSTPPASGGPKKTKTSNFGY